MIRLGLTGSIGMGKSTVAQMLRDLGHPVFDADQEVHRLQSSGGALVAAIEAAFPDTTDGEGVDRAKLGSRVLHDTTALRRLEAIVHPAVAAARTAFLDHHRDDALVIFDIPLLFEKGGDASVDVVMVVSAPADVQRARVMARPGMTTDRFASILARQMPDPEKRRRADIVIDTGTTIDATRDQVTAAVACLLNDERR